MKIIFMGNPEFAIPTLSKLIDSNIANLTNVRSSKGAKFAQNLATRKQLIQMNFYNKVNNGMSPKDAYLDVLQNDFSFDAIPNLKIGVPDLSKESITKVYIELFKLFK